MTSIAFYNNIGTQWTLTGDFSRSFLAGFLYGSIYSNFRVYPLLAKDERKRMQYYFEVRGPGKGWIFHGGDRDELMYMFPEIFSAGPEFIRANMDSPDNYQNDDNYRFWLRDVLESNKMMLVSVRDVGEFLRGLFTALIAWNVPYDEVLLSNLHHNHQQFTVQDL